MKLPEISIGKIIDWFGKNISRIKTAGVILTTCLMLFSFVRGGCSKKEAVTLIQTVTGLDIANGLLKKENLQLADSLVKEVLRREALQKERDALLKEKKTLSNDNASLRKKIADIPLWVLNLPVDSSYKFLDEKAYPFPGEKRFPFNEPQVKNIHVDFLENVELHGLVDKLDLQLKNCEKIGEVSDSMTLSFQRSYSTAMGQNSNLQEQVSNATEKAGILEKGLDKTTKRKNFWRVTAGILAGATAVLLLL